jgi:hypothetical protein
MTFSVHNAMKRQLFSILLVVLAVCSGCSDDPVTPSKNKGIEFSVKNMQPSRSGEIYALWVEYATSGIAKKGGSPQHGSSAVKLVSTFDIDNAGNITGLDTTNLEEKLGIDLALIIHGQVSVEKAGDIGSSPRSPLMIGEVTGSSSTGKALLTVAHSEAIGFDFLGVTGKATFASPDYALGDYKGELYLMNATSSSSISNGLDKLPPLPSTWKYGMWVVDSATESHPPFNIFYGYFSTVSGNDSNPLDNRFAYPGGRYPADTTQAVKDMTSGDKMNIIVSLEPNFGTPRPTVPFGAFILRNVVPQNIGAFTPFDLTNTASMLPTGELLINR